jgi:hypothetical protein
MEANEEYPPDSFTAWSPRFPASFMRQENGGDRRKNPSAQPNNIKEAPS